MTYLSTIWWYFDFPGGKEDYYRVTSFPYLWVCGDMRFFETFVLLLMILLGLSLCPVTGEVRVTTPESFLMQDSAISPDLQAEFTAAPTSGRAPLMVQFYDLSKGNPVSWNWDFGDGGVSRNDNPIHTYTQGGEYSVQLLVYDQDGRSDTVEKEHYITARPVPLDANFTATPPSGPVPLTVQFTDRSTGAMVWLWNFGDGSRESMLPDPSHTFQVSDTYKVVLKAGNQLGETDIHEQEIIVSSSEQVTAAFIATPTSGPVPLTVQFMDQSTGNVISWLWDFGDGTVDSTRNPVHTYRERGIYPVTLTVSSAGKSTDTKQKEDYITVTYSPVSGSILLSPGWNFVSVPRMLVSGKDTAEIFQHIDAGGHSAFQYAPALGGWIPLVKSSPLRPFEAYWIYSVQKAVVPLSFDPIFGQVSSRTLQKGWNAAGFICLNPVDAKTALLSVKDTWQNCIGFNPELQRYDEMIFKGINENTSIYPYRGYWVYLSAEGVLSGSFS